MTRTLKTVEAPITEHPGFRTPMREVGVRVAFLNPDTGDWVPEDRSRWRQDLEGKTLADFWDDAAQCFTGYFAESLRGITHFLKVVIEEQP